MSRIYAVAGHRATRNRLRDVLNVAFTHARLDVVCAALAAETADEVTGLARAAGLQGIISAPPAGSDGELLSHAASAFTLVTGCRPPVVAMRAELRKPARRKKNIALIGFSGSGKSTVARELGRMTGMSVVDTDSSIEERSGSSIPEIFRQKGEDEFRRMERDEIGRLRHVSKCVVACGGGVVTSQENVELLRRTCIPVWLWAGVATALERIARSGTRPLLFVDDPEAAARNLLEKRLPLYGAACDLLIDTEGREAGKVAERIRDEVGEAIEN